MEPSNEQRCIITSLESNNGICNAVAGAGKTTLIKHVCLAYPLAKIEVLTYNRELHDDTCEMIQKLNAGGRVRCHTYHGLLYKLANSKCFNDVQFMNLLHAKWEVPASMDFDILVIDETQDMRKHHMQLIQRTLRSLKKTDCIFLVVGDVGQRIYGFFTQNPADSRFLLHANVFLQEFTQRPFIHHQLTVSYRTTPHIANFVNFITRKETTRAKIVAGNHKSINRKVQFIIDYPSGRSVFAAICDAVKRHGAEHVMLLANSIKNRGIRDIVNKLSGKFKFYVPIAEDNSDKFITKGKITVNTFCSAKGLERKAIFVFGLSSASFYHENEVDPNQVYVALTRSCGGELTIIQDFRVPLFSAFGSIQELEQIAEVHHTKPIDQFRVKNHETKKIKFNVTQLTDYVDTITLNGAIQMLNIVQLRPPSITDEFKTTVRFGSIVENVSNLVQTSLKFALELQHTNQIRAVSENILDPIIADNPQEYGELFMKHGDRVVERKHFQMSFPPHKLDRVKTITTHDTINIVHLTELAAASNGFGTYHHLMSQINNFEWARNIPISPPFAQMINASKDKQNRFFEPCSFTGTQHVNLSGRADMIVGQQDAWTFKWNKHLTQEHILQAAVTACITDSATAKLYNMRSDEMIQIQIQDRTQFIEYMISAKTATSTELNDEQFFQINNQPIQVNH